ncbi:MAG: RNA-binding transcriptional accessory protein, partial [Shinella sp.]|nr:RNA-binding transcriptional accessory protein [Shinella sp.]
MAPTPQKIANLIASEIKASAAQVSAAVGLLDEGATVPFIARYRKEVTGGLDDTQLRTLSERLTYLRELEARRASILESIAGQGKLTDDLAGKIASVMTKAELEDIYLPYKPKRRTKAEIARERGLGPLAEQILADRALVPAELAEKFLSAEVLDVKAALEGARDIVAEQLTENADLLKRLRDYMKDNAFLRSRVVEGKQEAGAKFSDYFDHTERWATVPGHRALAMLRGWNEEFLSVDIVVDQDSTEPVKPVERIIASFYPVGVKPGDKWLAEVIGWTWRVKLSMSLSLDLMREMRERS